MPGAQCRAARVIPFDLRFPRAHALLGTSRRVAGSIPEGCERLAGGRARLGPRILIALGAGPTRRVGSGAANPPGSAQNDAEETGGRVTRDPRLIAGNPS